MTSPDVGKLRELAESALVDDERQISHEGGNLLARGLHSALDALEASQGVTHQGHLISSHRFSWQDVLLLFRAMGGDEGTARMAERVEAAEASRDQAIKERDEHAGRLEAIRAIATHNAERHTGFVHIGRICALAGVPGGSPEEEEHNPGGTAVAVPGSEIEGRTDVQH